MLSRIPVLKSRTVLRLDGILCLLMGAALVALRHVLAGPTGLPPGFLAAAGAALLPIGLFILAVGWPERPRRAGVAIVVAGNVLWVLASIGVLAFALVTPTLLGAVIIVAQAVVVAVVAFLEAAPLGSAPHSQA